jgi:YD repeat-containing protein
MRKYIVLILIMFYSFFAMSQNNDYLNPLKNILPKTPDAASLDKFIDMPPGNYTGTASVTVPIYTVSSYGFNLPISIDYHASGVKVNEVSSRIGLGWAMNIGNVSLSKQVVGSDDIEKILDYEVLYFDPYPPITNTGDTDYITACKANGVDGFPKKDTQPDIYYFNLNGNSGKFVIDSNGDFHTIPYNPVKIERGFNGFILTNTDGIKYVFQLNGMQYTISGSGSENNGRTNYKITEIELLNHEKIYFSYEGINYKYIICRNESETIYLESEGFICNGAEGQAAYGSLGYRHQELNVANNFETYLKEILFSNGRVVFNYSNQKTVPETRQDIFNDVFIYNIQVQNNLDQNIRNFYFNQSYFESPGYVLDSLINAANPNFEIMRRGIYYRLKLNSVEEMVSGTKWFFDYHEEIPLPTRLSFDTDYWGYYNGANNPTDLPRVLFFIDNRFYGEADKEPNLAFGKMGALKKVTFPTGGTQEIEYENDDFYYSGIIPNYIYHEFEIKTPDFENFDQLYPFALTGDIDQRLEFESTPNHLANDPEGSLPDGDHIYGELLDNNLNVVKKMYLNSKVRLNVPITTNQNYYLRIKKETDSTFVGKLKMTWYTNESYSSTINKKVGSLRIKKITLNDSIGKKIVRQYEYKNPESGYSSGLNHGDELIPYMRTSSVGSGRQCAATENGVVCDFPCDGNCKKWVLNSSSGINFSSVQGKSVGYDYVKEIFTDETNPINNYYSLSKFSNVSDDNIQLTRFSPFVPREDNSFMRGLLLEKKLIDRNNQTKLFEKNEYEFDYHFNSPNIPNHISNSELFRALKIDLINICYATRSVYHFEWKGYSILSAWVKKVKEETEENFPSGTVYTQKTYSYDLAYEHTFPTIITNKTSQSSIYSIVKNYYPQDSEITGKPFMQQLIDQNRTATPIVTQTFRNSEKLSEQETEYGSDTSPNSLILPKFIYTRKGEDLPTNASENRITFNNYDAKGNITQYTLEGGIPVSILWGYNKTQPIAKIENATNAQVTSLLGMSVTDTTEANMSAINDLRVSLPNAMISTYTYIPLVGVETITDPKGDRMTYEYDAFGRLQAVFDKNGNKLSENEYHYATQN